MYSFFVLGQIPGTSIVITFTMWMELCAAVFCTAVLYILVHTRNHSSVTDDEQVQQLTEIAI